VLKVQRGESLSDSKLPKRSRKSEAYFLLAGILGLLAAGSYQSGNAQLFYVLGGSAVVSFFLGISD
jgi:hypothetical protein